jgi:hypothetical protein
VVKTISWSALFRSITRAYKHNDAPSKADINEAIVREVLNELHEWFDFDETKEGI